MTFDTHDKERRRENWMDIYNSHLRLNEEQTNLVVRKNITGTPCPAIFRDNRANKFALVLFLGKAQRRLAVAKNRLQLVRLADAAIVYFWKYRKTNRLPADSDTTLGIASARKDLTLQPLLDWLKDWEKQFINRGFIPPDVEDRPVEAEYDSHFLMQHERSERKRWLFALAEWKNFHRSNPESKVNLDLLELKLKEALDCLESVNALHLNK